MKKGKLLIPMLFMCMVLTAVPAMKSNAEDAEGEQTSSEIQDENSQSQESVTAMDENGNITEVGDSDGVVEDEGSNARARRRKAMRQPVIRKTEQGKPAMLTEIMAQMRLILGQAMAKSNL